ncbi:MAG TPA: signal peptidase I [Armatimonadota bacterium]|nr:signal peptidase I [Armatimonadota bacterium]
METTGINGLIDWLANIRLWQVVVIAAILFAIRMFLKPYKSRQAKSALETVDSALIAVVLVFLVIRPFLVQTFFIPSGSMLPTLELGDRLLVSKIDYRFGHPKRGDIIVFKAPPEASPKPADFIKRLVGLPGDVLEVKDGALYRNGKRLNEPYLNDEEIDTYIMDPIKVPKGTYYVMGDNRNYSHDSHAWGALDQNRVIGKAMFRFWPPMRIGLMH